MAWAFHDGGSTRLLAGLGSTVTAAAGILGCPQCLAVESDSASAEMSGVAGAATPLDAGPRAPLPLSGPDTECAQITTPNGGLAQIRAVGSVTCPEATAVTDRYLSDPAVASGGRWQLVDYDDGWTCLTTLYPVGSGRPSPGDVWKECQLNTDSASGRSADRAELYFLGAPGS